jgi:murein tripeptide amidase MpaA
MMEGLIQHLLSDTPEAKFLRSRLTFYLVPMLNVDGVINGNYRTNLLGTDLNRQWTAPDASLHPEVYRLKSLMLGAADGGRIALITDFHGHSW